MQFMRVKCIECGETIEIPVGSASYGCMSCGHFEHAPDNGKPTSDESTMSSNRADSENKDEIPKGELKIERIDEAENYFLQATFILHTLQANISVYGSNAGYNVPGPADVDLAFKYIDRCLEIWPDNQKYLNLKALFLFEGKNDRASAIALLERALELAPDDITVQDNLEKIKN